MHVDLNAYFLRHPHTGSGRYLVELARWLVVVDPSIHVRLLAPADLTPGPPSPTRRGGGVTGADLTPGPPFLIGSDAEGGSRHPPPRRGEGGRGERSAPVPRDDPMLAQLGMGGEVRPLSPRCTLLGLRSSLLARLGENVPKLVLEQARIPRLAAGVADVLHYPYFAAPVHSAVPVVVTVHDLIPLRSPLYRRSLPIRLYVRLVSWAASRAAWIITDSEASRRDLLRSLPVAPDRVAVIPLAPHEAYRPLDDLASTARMRQRLGLDQDHGQDHGQDRGDYLVYQGGFEARKNVPTLLRAVAAARARGVRVRLVVVGRVPPPGPSHPDVRGLAAELGLAPAVTWAGPLADDDSNALLNGARGFVFPSRYEGFGLPPLEAMAAGTPVVCANASSLPEVVGDAAITIAPDDVGGFAAAIERLCHDAELRARLRAAGLRQAATFHWERTARETRAVYEAVTGRRGDGATG